VPYILESLRYKALLDFDKLLKTKST
jgi:hypothetical protein